MTPNANHLRILAGRLSLAETEQDIEAQCRAWQALHDFIAPRKKTTTARAWSAYDHRRKEIQP